MKRTPQEQVVHFLSDMYSVEQQALAQLITAPKMAVDPILAADFRTHYTETEHQADLVRERLEALGGSPSAIKDAVMRLGGKGFLLFAKVQPETPGRLVDHAYSYEAMEWAGYDMLERFAAHVGDQQTADVARTIRAQERTMMERLERGFDAAEQVSHADLPQEKISQHVRKHLAEVHAFEVQSIQLLKKSESIAGSEPLEAIYSQLLTQSRAHLEKVERRLEALGSATSGLKDSALAAGGLNWGLFFQSQNDTPAKLAAFVYAVVHLEIGGYELLGRSAQRAGDTDTEQLCEQVLQEKRAMVLRLADTFEAAVQATLESLQS